jgi:hypothetical protein
MHFTKYNWNITLYFAWEFWFTNSELYWIGHWYHITSICEGFHEPNSKAIESWNYMMCFVIWPSVTKSNSEDWEKARLWDHKKSMCLMYFIIFGILQNLTTKTLEIAFQRLYISKFSGGACPQTPLACLTPSSFDLCLKNPRSAPELSESSVLKFTW